MSAKQSTTDYSLTENGDLLPFHRNLVLSTILCVKFIERDTMCDPR